MDSRGKDFITEVRSAVFWMSHGTVATACAITC